MKRYPRAFTVASLTVVMLAVACSDDGSATTAATTTTAAGTVTTAAVATTTTTAPATTTTAATTTTSDLHPAWDLSWAGVWPAEGATATYRLELFNEPSIDLPATVSYGIEWDGGIWDRIQIGSTEPGEYGLAFYFDRSEPWVLRVWGLRANGPGMGPQGSFDEYLGGSPEVDLGGLPGTAPTLEVGAFVAGVGEELYGPTPAVYAMEVVGLEEVEVPAGIFPVSLHLRFGLGGEFFGVEEGQPITAFSDLWVSPENLILRWDPAPGFGAALALVSPWE